MDRHTHTHTHVKYSLHCGQMGKLWFNTIIEKLIIELRTLNLNKYSAITRALSMYLVPLLMFYIFTWYFPFFDVTTSNTFTVLCELILFTNFTNNFFGTMHSAALHFNELTTFMSNILTYKIILSLIWFCSDNMSFLSEFNVWVTNFHNESSFNT